MAIWVFWLSENETPTRVNAETPLVGSLSALPSWMAEDFTSVPMAADMSTMSWEVWEKTPLACPALLATFPNVRSRFCPDWIASSSTAVLFEIDMASLPIWLAVTIEPSPIDLMTDWVRAVVTCASRASAIESLKNPATFWAANRPPIPATRPFIGVIAEEPKTFPNVEPDFLPVEVICGPS